MQANGNKTGRSAIDWNRYGDFSGDDTARYHLSQVFYWLPAVRIVGMQRPYNSQQHGSTLMLRLNNRDRRYLTGERGCGESAERGRWQPLAPGEGLTSQ